MSSFTTSVFAGVAVALALGIAIGGEDRVRQHLEALQSVTGGAQPPVRMMTKAELVGAGTAVAIGGIVYDVSPSAELYGESGWYKYFVGKDATLAFGTGKRIGYSLDTQLNNRDPESVDDASDEELSKVSHYMDLFDQKYRKLGLLVDGLYWNADGTPTEAREALDERRSKLRASGHFAPGDEDGEDAVFSTEQRESKCPIMKTARVVKQAAEEAQRMIHKYLLA
ncbi:Cytochrome P450 regulator dap1 [Diplonema papillatum]|nr:Cytochrome P450 regulator dap1 [Diplonema papillatum]